MRLSAWLQGLSHSAPGHNTVSSPVSHLGGVTSAVLGIPGFLHGRLCALGECRLDLRGEVGTRK